MSDVLQRICADKRQHVAAQQARHPLTELQEAARSAPPPRGFISKLQRTISSGYYALIAEIKKASPSKGLIRANFDPPSLACAYAAGGATCLSVLTDVPHFLGDDAYLIAARAAVNLPILRKDFLLEPYQIIESRALGADCILLILAALNDAEASELEGVAVDYGMDVLIEVHNAEEMARALKLKSPLIGVNNRNLKTLAVDLATTEALAAMAPSDRLLVSESGLGSRADLDRMASVGARCFLIGETLMRQDDVTAAVQALLQPAIGIRQATS
jgi:indole-3-glycerol phosphate synthase